MDVSEHADRQSTSRSFLRNRWTLATLGIIAGSLVGIFVASVVKEIRPQLLVPAEPVHLGAVLAGSTVKAQAPIKNGGLSRINLSVASTSCQCTTTELRRNVLGAKQSTILDVAIEVSQIPGPFEVHVRLASDDPRRPEADVYFEGVVIHPIEFNPPVLRFDDIEVSDLPISREVILRSDGVDISRLAKPTVSGSLRFVGSEIVWLDDTPRLLVSLARDAPSGLFRENLVLRFANFDYTYPAMGKILGPVDSVPDVFLFNSRDTEARLVSSVRMRAREGIVIDKLDVMTEELPTPDAFVFTALADAEGWLLKATLDPAAMNSADKLSGTVTVRVAVQNQAEPLYLRVPVLVALGKKK